MCSVQTMPSPNGVATGSFPAPVWLSVRVKHSSSLASAGVVARSSGIRTIARLSMRAAGVMVFSSSRSDFVVSEDGGRFCADTVRKLRTKRVGSLRPLESARGGASAKAPGPPSVRVELAA